MTLKIFNTLGKQKQEFVPLAKGKVKMYVCGPTVYDLLHVGNFRGAIFFNLVRNWLEHLGYQVTFVYNYTDVDDKIIKRANEEGVSASDLSQRFIQEFEKDFRSLNLKVHEHTPKCTDHMTDMVTIIRALVDKGKAYEVQGTVFYSIETFENYGLLSGKRIAELEVGHRVDPDPRKKNPLDFVLWKPAKEGEPSWDSPWGKGRPGWHIECSTLSRCYLGDSIDIHGGGIDLIFPHHENEIAQSEAVSGKPFVSFWMHNNFIQFGDEKMSKSLGNVVKARSFMEKYHPEILKFLMLSVHYRSPLNLDEDQIRQAMVGLGRIYSALQLADRILAQATSESKEDKKFRTTLAQATQHIDTALNDDFNTPAMFAVIFDMVREFNGFHQPGKKISGTSYDQAKAFKEWIKSYGQLTALFQEPADGFLRGLDKILINAKGIDVKRVEALVAERQKARQNKDFKAADKVRDELLAMEIIVHDSPTESTWEVKKG